MKNQNLNKNNKEFLDLFKQNYLILDEAFANQQAVFEKIDQICFKNKLINKKGVVKQLLIDREEVVSTAIGDGFAVPHCALEKTKQSAIFFVRSNDALDWKAHDNKKVNYIIVLVEGKGLNIKENMHLRFMAIVAQNLLKSESQEILKKSLDYNTIAETLLSESNSKSENNKLIEKSKTKENKYIIGVTSCTVGIAHTYMAAQKIREGALKLGYEIKVETNGAEGVRDALTAIDIKKADLVIIASDVNIDLTRFKGKRIYGTSTNKAMQDPIKTIKSAFKDAKVYNPDVSKGKNKNKVDEDFINMGKGRKGIIIPHVLSGVSYLVPVVVLGGLLLALSLGLSRIIFGKTYDLSLHKNSFLGALFTIGSASFTIMIPIFGGFIAYSIGGKAAIAPAFVVCFIANTPADFNNQILPFLPQEDIAKTAGLSFIGSILFGVPIGYTVLWMRSWKIPEIMRPIMPIIIIPILCGVLYGLLAIFIVGGLVGTALVYFKNWITNTWNSNNATGIGLGLGFGLLLGSMIGFDVGGPINKIAFLSAVALIGLGFYKAMGAVDDAIPVPPLGMGICALLFPKYWEKELRTFSGNALFMGFIGITEGSIPFLVAKPKQVFLANIIGSAIAGGIAGAVGSSSNVPQGGILVALLGGIGHTNDLSNIGYGAWPWILLNILFMLIGALVTCSLAFLFLWLTQRGIQNTWLGRKTSEITKVISIKMKKINRKKPIIKNKNTNNITLQPLLLKYYFFKASVNKRLTRIQYRYYY